MWDTDVRVFLVTKQTIINLVQTQPLYRFVGSNPVKSRWRKEQNITYNSVETSP